MAQEERGYTDFDEDSVIVAAPFHGETRRMLLPRDYLEMVGVTHARLLIHSRAFWPEHPDPHYNPPLSPEEEVAEALRDRMSNYYQKAVERRETATHAAHQPRRAHRAKELALQIAAEIMAKHPNLGPNAISERVVDRLAEEKWSGKDLPTSRSVRRWLDEPRG